MTTVHPALPNATRLIDFDCSSALWEPLALRADNIFSTWEWASCWWRHFGGGREVRIVVVEATAGEAVVLLPLQAERRHGIACVRFIGHEVADQLGPVCAADDLERASTALATTRGDLLLAERLPAEVGWGALKGCALRREDSPVIEIPGGATWEDYLSARSANFRGQVRRRTRRLSSAGVRFRLAHERDRLASDMDMLIALHRGRWGARARAFSGAREAFHRDFAEVAFEQGWLRLWLAEVEDKPVAAWLGFRFGEVEYFYQSGRDLAWDKHGVGAGLLEHSIREAFADGMREYRMLRGDEDYKRRYATAIRHVVTIAVPLTQRGRGVVAVARPLARSAGGRALLRRAV